MPWILALQEAETCKSMSLRPAWSTELHDRQEYSEKPCEGKLIGFTLLYLCGSHQISIFLLNFCSMFDHICGNLVFCIIIL